MTLQELDRSIFEVIRLELVNRGYLPDVTNYSSTQSFSEAKETLLQNQSQNNKQIIEVFGTGPSEARDQKKSSKIVIDRSGTNKGEFGAFGIIEHRKNTETGKFSANRLPSSTEDVNYEIRIITSTIKFERICQDVIYSALGVNSFLTGIETGEAFEIEKRGSNNVSATDLIEVILQYTVRNIFIEEDTVLSDNIAPLTEVGVKVKVIDLENTVQSEVDIEIKE